MPSHIIRVSRSDGGDFVILNVTPGSRNELDIEIEGTEGTAPFAASFKHHRIAKALTEQSNLSDEQWELAVRHLLLHQKLPGDIDAENLKTLKLSAHVSGNQLVLAFRRNISGIQQRVAEMSLLKDENRELDTIAWVSTAAERSETLELDIQGLESRCSRQIEAISALEQQLEELVQAKAEHEHDLLDKFGRLLNAKKLKIRNQQRLLTEKGKIQFRSAEIETTDSNLGTSHGRGKRKAQQRVAAVQDSGQGDNEESDHSVDKGLVSGQMTPDRTDEDGLSDESSDHDAALDQSAQVSDRDDAPKSNTHNQSNKSGGDTDPEQLPPRRVLPFSMNTSKGIPRQGVGKQVIYQEDRHVNDTTEVSTDDEL